MVILGTWGDRPITISVKPNCLTVSIDEPAEANVFSYDYAGRLWTAFLEGISYRRGLDGRIMAKWRVPGDERERRWLAPGEAKGIELRANQAMRALHVAFESGAATLGTPLPPEGHQGFERAIAFDAALSQKDAGQYHCIYKPIGILPPDQYMAVVLQVTEGCSFNTCTFCNFYRDRPFRMKPLDEFRAHAKAVRAFLGDGLSLRRTIFLADANALVVPTPRLLPLVEAIHEVYDVAQLGGIYAFLDGFSGEKKSISDFRALAERGLTRVYVGLESGNPDLLHFLRKPGVPEDAIRAVRAMKSAGLRVGVIVLLGAGGHRYGEAHVRDTIDALNAMQLGMDDIIYLSELIVSQDLDYAQKAAQAGLMPFQREERIAQGEAIRRGLRFSPSDGTPHISRYDIREFVY
jgi:hypothetical protein